MTAAIRLPGRPLPLLVADPGWDRGYPPPVTRRVLAAAHVAVRPGGEIDWESTLGFRDFLWDYGFGVAEAMDTAQRGTGLSWAQARELIARSAARRKCSHCALNALSKAALSGTSVHCAR